VFLRGQKVIVTKSTATKRSHPAVGDTGYIDNMFLFPELKCILANIFFCNYKKGGARVEQKHFIIDIGMSHSNITLCKRADRLFFVSEPHINLNPVLLVEHASHRYGRIHSFPKLISTHGIWSGYSSKDNKRSAEENRKVKIPCGKIVLYKSSRKKRSDTDITELIAWLKSVMVEIHAATHLNSYAFVYNHSSDFNIHSHLDSIWKYISPLFNKDHQLDNVDYLQVRDKQLDVLDKSVIESLVKSVSKMLSINRVYMSRLTDYFVNNSTESDKMINAINNQLRYTSALKLMTKEHIRSEYKKQCMFIASYIVRTLFTSSNVYHELSKLNGCLPASWDIEQISKIAVDSNTEANNDCAALNRILDLLESTSMVNTPPKLYESIASDMFNKTLKDTTKPMPKRRSYQGGGTR